MFHKKPNYRKFVKDGSVAKSLVNDVQVLIGTQNFKGAADLLRAVPHIIPQKDLIALARQEAPIRMLLRGETKSESATSHYEKAASELWKDLTVHSRATESAKAKKA